MCGFLITVFGTLTGGKETVHGLNVSAKQDNGYSKVDKQDRKLLIYSNICVTFHYHWSLQKRHILPGLGCTDQVFFGLEFCKRQNLRLSVLCICMFGNGMPCVGDDTLHLTSKAEDPLLAPQLLHVGMCGPKAHVSRQFEVPHPTLLACQYLVLGYGLG